MQQSHCENQTREIRVQGGLRRGQTMPKQPLSKGPAACSARARRNGAGAHQWPYSARKSISARMTNHEDVVEARRRGGAPDPVDTCQAPRARKYGGTGVEVSPVGHGRRCREGALKGQLRCSTAGESAPGVLDKVDVPGAQRGEHGGGMRLRARGQELGAGIHNVHVEQPPERQKSHRSRLFPLMRGKSRGVRGEKVLQGKSQIPGSGWEGA